jgi:hypothetical protein
MKTLRISKGINYRFHGWQGYLRNPCHPWSVFLVALSVLLSLALVAGMTVAQQRLPQQKEMKEADNKSKDLLARVAKDMQAAEERLKKTDPGDMTRKIQRDVIDGLEELIKQNSRHDADAGAGTANKMQGGRGQQQGGAPRAGAGGKKGERQDNQFGPSPEGGKAGDGAAQEQHGHAKGSNDGRPEVESKDKGTGKSDGKDDKEGTGKEAGKEVGKEPGNKDGDKSDEKGQAKGNDPGNSQGRQGGLASIKNAKSSRTSLTAEIYRADWGHLPLTKRLEMDAYSRERFMPRYDEMLQQYYRTVAEQGKKK